MAEYVERETLLKHAIALNNPHELGENVVPVSDIEEAPAADVETVRHGQPVYKNRPEHYDTYAEVHLYDGDVLYKREHHIAENNPVAYCPECGKRLCTRFTNYCPNCGALMDGEDEDNV